MGVTGVRRRTRLAVAAGVLAALAGAMPAAAADEAPVTGPIVVDPGDGTRVTVPVLGRTTISLERNAARAKAVALVHGVRRVPGGTVLYWSVGLPKGADTDMFNEFGVTRPYPMQDRFSRNPLGGVQLVDGASHKVYTVLVDSDEGAALASPNDAFTGGAGVLRVLYAVFPELPPQVRSIDVAVGEHDIVPAVPVQEGVLEPVKPADAPIRLGEGWPRIDLEAVRSSYRPKDGIYTWWTEIRQGDVTTRQRSEQVSVDLAADVLFAVDSDRLTPAAQETLRTAAAAVSRRTDGGRLTVVGHTDSTGSAAHNDDLSKRRAQAVAIALQPLVTVPGVMWQVSGKGEREPVASNDTAEGRKTNRRVSVVFTPKATS